ncbi:GDSL-type esterase/lipase family protein [Haloferula sp. A504]|uniref:GDSL-type esterase/lipase family protein n=1 Tax=Haloferula sp. A504 TaxID=3373601 RepID=UPI0031BD720E|nr:GDSL-type esterase/lipase family protein [Verrucomicrobiaceae bacterium E54]
MKHLTTALAVLAGCLTSTLDAQITLDEDFESSTAGSNTPPAGWSLVQTAGTATYATSSAGAGSNGAGGSAGLAGQVSATAGVGNNGLPGAYLVNTAAIDLSNAVSGTFDFLMPNEAGFDDVGFIIGDVANGITGTSAGELLYARITEGNPNAIAGIIQDGTSDGTSDVLASEGATISDDTWYRATVTWTPTGGTTGDFTITINDFSTDILTVGVTGFTFDSANAQIGFGSINDTIRFDNVDFTYTPVGPDLSPPTLVGITDDQGGASVEVDVDVTYTVEFSEDIDEGTVSSADFANAGSSNLSFGTITETSPGIFSVVVTPTTSGTLQLSIPTTADIQDPSGNLLDSDPALLDDTIITVTMADTTPPAWIAGWPQVDGVTTTGATARARIDETGTAYFVVVADGDPAPSAAQVKAGDDSSNSPAIAGGSIALSADTESTAAITGLTPGTTYDVYFVAEDDATAPNLQTNPALVIGITTQTPSPSIVFYDFEDASLDNPTTEATNTSSSTMTGAGWTSGSSASFGRSTAGNYFGRGPSDTAGTSYIEFTITAVGGYSLHLTELAFDYYVQAAQAGSQFTFEVRSSLDGFVSSIPGNYSANPATVGTPYESATLDLSGGSYDGLASITFRLYATSSAPPLFTDILRWDNITVSGSVAQADPDPDPPTLVGITDDRGGASVEVDVPVTYTVEFSEDINEGTVSAADFANAGSANVNFGAITEASPGIFTVVVTPTNEGTLRLSIPTAADIRDPSGNPLVSDPALLDDTTITVTAPAALGLKIVSADPAANVDLLLTGPASSPYFVYRSSDLEGPLYRKRWEQRFADAFPASGSEIPLQESTPAEDRSFYIATNTEPKARIMCVGDSITEGGTGYFVYRPVLNGLLTTAGYRYEFVGSKTNTQQGVTLKHEGYSGQNATQVAANLATIFPAHIADIVLIHAGHNYFADIQGEASIVNEVDAATRSMIATCRTHNPDVVILLAQVITSSKLPKYSYIPALNTRLTEVATDLDSPEQPVIIVNQADGWDPVSDTVADQVHPTEGGAAKMADKWFAALQPLLD